MKALLLVLTLLATVPARAEQSAAEELEVIGTAVRHHFKMHQPYIKKLIVLNHETELLEPASERFWSESVRVHYQDHNAKPLRISSIVLPQNFTIADLSKYGGTNSFDWETFEEVYGNAYALRSSRPTFISNDRVVLRLDLAHPRKANGRPMTIGYELQRHNGAWEIVPGPLLPMTERPN